ncbi:MAG TPA: glycosyltransferase family 4 protein [Candidatus Fermentibacter daniensis]|nr:glycosyltransferase family 4 protein [Candidatus Fermentibacter daniensis]
MKQTWCFVGGGVRALSGLPDGGSERQVMLLSTELAARGNRVALLVPGPVDADRSSISGVEIVQGWRPESRWPRGIRLWADRLPSLRRAMGRLDPDFVYTRGFSVFAPSVAGAAGRMGVAYLAALACDDDLRTVTSGSPRGAVHSAVYGRIARAAFVRLALRRASIVLSQHSGQLKRCRAMGLESVMVRNAFVPFEKPRVVEGVYDACWIGHLSAFKGFDRLLELLGRIAGRGWRIAVAGSVQGSECRAMLDRARSYGTMEYLGEIPHREALSVIASSKILLNTSPSEGFSNAFLEAWFLERPVLSLNSDPDGLLSGEAPLGICAGGSMDLTEQGLVRLLSDEELRRTMGRAGRCRIETHHIAGAVVDSLERAAAAAAGR